MINLNGNLSSFNEDIDSTGLFSYDESASEVDGKYVLAKVKGPSFFPGVLSGNNRMYSREAWDRALARPEFQTRLKDRLIFGTIGHDTPLTDKEIREGLHSHVLIDAYIDENNVGIGEYLIMNTGPGAVLNNILRINSKIRVSTKCKGLALKNSKYGSGVTEMDPSVFFCERIDFVIDPGYSSALPSVIESSTNLINSNEILNTEGHIMSDKLIEVLESRITELKGDNGKLVQEFKEQIINATESLNTANSELAAFKALGTFKVVQESMSELDQFKEVGDTPQEISDHLDDAATLATDLSAKIEELAATLAVVQNDAEAAKDKVVAAEPEVEEDGETAGELSVADPLNLTDAEELEAYRSLGTVEDISALLDVTESLDNRLSKLGTIDEIENLVASCEAMADDLEAQAIAEQADLLGATAETITDLMEKGMSLEEACDLIKKIKGTSAAVEAPVAPVADVVDPETIVESLSSKLMSRDVRRVAAKLQTVSESKVSGPELRSKRQAGSLVARLMTKQK